MLDLELNDNLKVCIKIPKAEFNVNDIVKVCKALSASISKSFFEKILYKIQAQLLDHYLGVAWHSKPHLVTPWTCPRCGASWAIWVQGCSICNQYARMRAERQNTESSSSTRTWEKG